MTKLEDYKDYDFETGCYRTPEYIAFERKYRNYIKKNLPLGYSLHSFQKGHFEFSAVIKTDTNNFIYISIPDVRGCNNEWLDSILIRNMEHEKDWRGKQNNYTDLKCLMKDIVRLNDYGNTFRRYSEAEM